MFRKRMVDGCYDIPFPYVIEEVRMNSNGRFFLRLSTLTYLCSFMVICWIYSDQAPCLSHVTDGLMLRRGQFGCGCELGILYLRSLAVSSIV